MRRSLLLGPRIVPTEPVELIEDHPLAVGMRNLWLLNGNFDDLGLMPARGTPAGAVSMSGAVAGPMLSGDGSSASLNFGTAIPILPLSFTVSLRAVLHSYTNSSYQNPTAFGRLTYPGNNNTSWVLYSGGDGPSMWGFGAGGSSVHYVTDSVNVNLNELYHLCGTLSTADGSNWTQSLYVNGVLAACTTYSQSMSYDPASTTNIGSYGGTFQYFNGLIGDVAIHTLALSADLVAWLAAEPFAMLRPKRRQKWYVLAGSFVFTAAPVTWSWAAKDTAMSADLGVAGRDWQWSPENAALSVMLTGTQKGWGWRSAAAVMSATFESARATWASAAVAAIFSSAAQIIQARWTWTANPILGVRRAAKILVGWMRSAVSRDWNS